MYKDAIFGFFIGVGSLAMLLYCIPQSTHNRYITIHKKITQCEATIPRNQHCELIAVPKLTEVNK